MTEGEVLEEVKRRVRTRLKGRRYRLYLFGSRARKEGSPRSDYDLALLADPPLDLATLAELREALEGLPILQPLDLVELSWAPGLKEVVKREGILLDEEEKLRAQMASLARAVERLKAALERPKDEFIRDSAIQRFEFTFELAWKTLKTFLELQGLGPAPPARPSGELSKWASSPRTPSGWRCWSCATSRTTPTTRPWPSASTPSCPRL